ncbi:type II toxin-antitoxin system HipA family toxin [Bacteroides sp. UBA939]|uniref:type II toxin-antitoxin system HipA family toxin n=1 Tax=Bacteroides sp. UBA939 TaxID=1946092 RepID=UPI0025B80283|nr:HipA domain-containing protein [Bacteroides sp. UBA939]
MKEIKFCPSTLSAGYHTYSPPALRRVFDKQKVSHILPYESIEKNEDDAKLFMDNKKRISISGVQSKYSMVVEDGELRLTPEGEQGKYILKPKPAEIRNPQECAANENLTMQIAEQVFKLETATNGLAFFQSGEIAYITKRFDIAPDGSKYKVEDFASLAGITSDNAGANFKYNYSYEEVAELIKKYLPAWRVELLKYYRLILFNFLFSNGDAHLKNFSVIDIGNNDFRLTPAYDLLNTRIHVDDSDFALDKGLFKIDRPEYFKGGKANGETFRQFGLMIDLPEKVVEKELVTFTAKLPLIDELIDNSFLSGKVKRQYRMLYQTRRNRLADMKF